MQEAMGGQIVAGPMHLSLMNYSRRRRRNIGAGAGGVSGGDTSETPPLFAASCRACGVSLRRRIDGRRTTATEPCPRDYALTLRALLELLVELEFSRFRISS